MLKKKSNILIFSVILSALVSAHLSAETIVIPIEGMIDLGLPLTVKRGIEEAESQNAEYIVFLVNTFGGRVDAATEIKDAIIGTDIRTAAFVNSRAISAGALITLSCDQIFMTKGSTIGAVTPVNQQGQKLTEKQVSYMRAEMRSTCEARGRDPLIGEAMVDETIAIPDISEEGKLLTLTAEEALKLGFADKIIEDEQKLYDYLGIKSMRDVTVSLKETIVRLLTNPAVASILLTLGMVGIFFELRSPGFGFPGIIGILAFAAFIMSHYILRMANWIEISAIILGLILLLLEIFVIPGFGLAGISGIILVFGGLYFSMISDIPYMSDYAAAGAALSTIILLSVLFTVLSYKTLVKTKTFRKLTLQDDPTTDMSLKVETDISLVGKGGISVTVLRPSGKVEIDGAIYQAVSNGSYIEKNTKVIVKKIESNNIIVAEDKSEV